MLRLLLRIYPARFRERFGDELLETLSQAHRCNVLRLGYVRALAASALDVTDVIAGGVIERVRALDSSTEPAAPAERRGLAMFNLLQDARFALRTLAKQPAFAAIVIVTVALGVGANTAMFTIVNGVLLTPLPYDRADELVRVYQTDRFNDTQRENASGPDYFYYLEQQTQFASLAAYTGFSPTLTDGLSDPERVNVLRMSHTLFPMLGRDADLGRVPAADEDVPDGARVAVLSHGFWRRRFGADSSIIGRPISLDGAPVSVVGVMPRGFEFPPSRVPPVDLWVPLQYGPASSSRGVHDLAVVARLSPGATVATAQAEMSRIMATLEERYPDDNVGRGANVRPLQSDLTGDVRGVLLLLMGCVGLVLLIACCNVANLLLSRGTARQREVAVRAALGAGRGRIVRQLLVESLVIGGAGGVAGVGLALAGVRLLRALDAGALPRLSDVSVNPAVLGFALLLSGVTALIFGALPALAVSKTNLNAALAEGGRTSTSGRSGRLRAGLAIGQVAIAFVLVVAAGLTVRSMWNLLRVDPGFRATGLVRVAVNLPDSRYPLNLRTYPASATEVRQFHGALLERVRRLPFVSAAALAVNDPLDPGWTSRVIIEGGPETVEEGVEEERIRPVSSQYFSTIGATLLRGRDFDERDRGDAAPVVIVNESFARKYFPDADPLVSRVRFWGSAREIVGVVSDVKFMGVAAGSEPAVYAPLTQLPFPGFAVIARGSAEPARTINAVRAAIRQLDPELAVFNAASFEAVLARSVGPERFNATLFGLFAGLAMTLAAVGIYGVVSYGVSRRTHEFGVRMSFGADRRDIGHLVLSKGLKITATGIVIGLIGSLGATRLMSGMLFGVAPDDPTTLGAVALFLAAVAMIAALVPARRASRVDPMVALRQE